MPEQQPKPYSPADHQIWLEAHLALGKLEVKQGSILSWRERSDFIKNYIADRTAASD